MFLNIASFGGAYENFRHIAAYDRYITGVTANMVK
jgi:hypothetical protein